MEQHNNFNLSKHNTFGISANCQTINIISTTQDILSFKTYKPKDYYILGGGSNILITKDIDLPIIKNEIKGKEIIQDNGTELLIEVGAGENWHDFVMWCVENDFGGLENLSLIPGTVGAAPVQNIGAYGVEIKSKLDSLIAYEIESGERKEFLNHECQFEYRDSIFKNKCKGKYLISHVRFRLTKSNHKFIVNYKPLLDELHKNGQRDQLSIRQISEAVVAIRKSKLPDPRVLGNAGSFFKNVVIDEEQYLTLKKRYPELVAFEHKGEYKLASGWLIDYLGWKGKRDGQVGCHEKQALVIVNYGGATGTQIWNFAKKIQEDVLKHFGITLEPEVNIWP